MMYEIINPSDPYTLESDDFKVAAGAVLLVGQGKYGMCSVEEDSETLPVFLLGGAEEWLKEHDMYPFDEWLRANAERVAACLETVIIGSLADRKRLERVLACISDPEERAKARFAHHDEKRSSLNDIGKACGIYAKKLRSKIEEWKSENIKAVPE